MRTQKEIKKRLIKTHKSDMFGFEWYEYLKALNKTTAKTLIGTILKEDTDLTNWNDWKPTFKNNTDIKKQCIEYMPFAWEKANTFRGISSFRSLEHYKAWLWMIGENKFDNISAGYEYYGKDNLRRICKFLKLDADKWDDGVRLNEEPEEKPS